MIKFQNLIADLNKLQDEQDMIGVGWVTDKLEPLVEEGLRQEKGKDAHIRGLNNKIEKLEKQIEEMKWQVEKVRAVVPFCIRCDQPFCNMKCR